ncbi:MAG: hypothetical protein HKL91_03050 [Candidatus Eremiobacteraeota bacterium]|uniref:Uncharacterized protein n=1 Tax=mine drainage metagenome TaxID=410659 RepID=E6PFJ6_9ZZZZ|nr:hypothetical protein [Candidatus Eremiobacteraeota bacterium]
MQKLLVRIAAAVAALSLFASAAQASADVPRARYSDVASYVGAPKLAVTLSMILAGGGPARFQTTRLLGVLAGSKTKAEVAKLTKEYGKASVVSFLTVFNYVVDDALKIVKQEHVALPSSPNPSPSNGKALAAALYHLGVTNGGFDVEYMLDGLVSHPIHVRVMNDIDLKYGRPADANYHKVLQTAMTDLKGVYGL